MYAINADGQKWTLQILLIFYSFHFFFKFQVFPKKICCSVV